MRDHTTARSSSSSVLYLDSCLFKNLLAKAIVCRSWLRFCSMQAPSPFALASNFTRVCFDVSKCLFSIIWCIFVLMLLNAELCSSLQCSFLFLDSGFFFNSGRSGSERLARFGINLVRWWTLPRNDRNCFNVFGLSSFVIASVFVTRGVIRLGVIVKPSHSMMFFCEFAFL